MQMQKVKTGIQYIIAQCVGGVLGAYAAFNLLPGQHPFVHYSSLGVSVELRVFLSIM